jgi:hypothetical protein
MLLKGLQKIIRGGIANMNLKTGLVLASIVLIFLSVANGLEFGATTSSSDVVSATSVGYAATKDDFADQHVQLNTGEGTLSNAYAGTGSLSFGRNSISNTAYGTYADVERQIIGTGGQTFWFYDWGTSIPGTGQVRAWLNMDVQNAMYIYGQSYASNRYGYTQNIARVDSGSSLSSSISNYAASAVATPTLATSTQSANLATGKDVSFRSYASNNEGDYSRSELGATGTATNLGSAFRPSTNGQIASSSAYSYVSDPASRGLKTYMKTFTQDRALAREGGNAGNVYLGTGQFGVQKNNYNWLQGSSSGTATASNVYLSSSANVASNQKAYMLEPYKHWAVNHVGQIDALQYQFDKLMSKGWACTYYTDAAVTKSRVGEMDDYYFSTIIGHMNNGVIGISRAGDSDVTAADLKSMITKSTGLIILNGCESFKPNSAGTRPLYEALKDKAWVSMGNVISVGVIDTGTYQKKFIDIMTDSSKSGSSRTASIANTAAATGSHPKMTLLPSNHDIYLTLS